MRLTDADALALELESVLLTGFINDEALLYEIEDKVLGVVRNAPTIQVARPEGKWIYGNGNGECSVCGREKSLGWDNYCAFCGAKMR